MAEKKQRDFCTRCRKETEYSFTKRGIVKNIHGRNYPFFITVAICSECGAEMSPPGLMDKNVQEIEEQHKAIQGFR